MRTQAHTVKHMNGRTETLTIRLSPEVKAALAKLAAADRRPVSQYVALLIEDHVKAKQSGS
jgi:predicted transcriptional regulator